MIRNGYQHMVLDDFVASLRDLRATRLEMLGSLTSRDDVAAYQDYCLDFVRRAFSPIPKRTPLRPRITGKLEAGPFRIEKLLLESRPGFLVSANLYVPQDRRPPFPVVLGTCGHSLEGKAAAPYHSFCQRLVRNGFMVLIYEPCNQGERDQYIDVPNRECVAGCCNAHNMMGKQMELIGEYYGMWRAWDGIRCLDYLLGRREADPTRVGVTGNSGGGTMTEWLWAVEDRFTMAAPSCFVTTFMHNLENELPADCEQYPPGVIEGGLEMVDLMVPRAPKPLLLLGQKYDFFDRRGLQEAYVDLRLIYQALGCRRNVELFVGSGTHGYSEENQKAMVAFFCKHAGLPPPSDTVVIHPYTPADLQVTGDGSVIHAGSKPVFELIDGIAARQETRRRQRSAKALLRKLNELLVLPLWSVRDQPAPHFRVLRPVGAGGKTFARYAVETERDIRAILRKRLVNPGWGHSLDVEGTVHLYLPHVSCEEDLGGVDWVKALNPDGSLYALDPRGLGESAPEGSTGDAFFQPYGLDYMLHGHSILYGESYLGRRVYDVLRTMELLQAEGAGQIHLHGRGQGALLALFAGVLHPAAGVVTLCNGPLSYRDWTRVPLLRWPAANCLRGVLQVTDLPEVMALLGDRLRVREPWGPDMQPMPPDAVSAALAAIGLEPGTEDGGTVWMKRA